MKISKTQGEKTKLKEKTQDLGGTRLLSVLTQVMLKKMPALLLPLPKSLALHTVSMCPTY